MRVGAEGGGLSCCDGRGSGHAGVGAQVSAYYYLPEEYNAAAQISVAEFAALRLTAYYNSPGALTSKLVRQSVRCFLGEHYIDLFVDTLTQTSWDAHVGAARFSVSDAEVMRAYSEAGAVATQWLALFFPDVDPARFRVIFTIKGYEVGIYTQGRFTLSR